MWSPYKMLFRYDSLPFRSFPISFVSSGSIASLFVVNISANAFIFLLIFSVLRCRQRCLCGDTGLGRDHAWCGNNRMTGLRRGPWWHPHTCALCCTAWRGSGTFYRRVRHDHPEGREAGRATHSTVVTVMVVLGLGDLLSQTFFSPPSVGISRSWGGRWKPMLITWTKDSQTFVSGMFQTSGLVCFVEKAFLVKRMSAECIIKETFFGQLLFQISM